MYSRFLIAVLFLTFTRLVFALNTELLPKSVGALEYKTVVEALEALQAKPGVKINVTKPDGWITASEGQDVIWSFAPSGHYAHPAVVRRALVIQPSGELIIEMRALCQAQKDSCDKLIREFEELNERMRQSVQQRIRQQR